MRRNELDMHSRNGLIVGAVEMGRFLRRMRTLNKKQSPMPNRTTARPPMTAPTIRPVDGGLDLLTVGDVVASDVAVVVFCVEVVVPVDVVEFADATFMKSRKNWVPETTA
jgi:hypothetical protein